MKIDLLARDGKPAGQIDVPDEIVSAAQRVNTWLNQQAIHRGVAVLCGVTLAFPLPTMLTGTPAIPVDGEVKMRLGEDSLRDQRQLWWKRDD
jgi:hypothetical protein